MRNREKVFAVSTLTLCLVMGAYSLLAADPLYEHKAKKSSGLIYQCVTTSQLKNMGHRRGVSFVPVDMYNIWIVSHGGDRIEHFVRFDEKIPPGTFDLPGGVYNWWCHTKTREAT